MSFYLGFLMTFKSNRCEWFTSAQTSLHKNNTINIRVNTLEYFFYDPISNKRDYSFIILN